MRINSGLVLLFFLCLIHTRSQGQLYTIDPHSYTTDLLDRTLILNGDQHFFHASVRPFDRRHIAQILSMLPEDGRYATDALYLIKDNQEWMDKNNTPDSAILLSHEWQFVDTQKVFYQYPSETIKNDDVHAKQGLFGFLYKSPVHLIEVKSPNFSFMLDPVLHFKIYDSDAGQLLFDNQRGLTMRGAIDQKLYFYLSILESQSRPADYIRDYEKKYSALPGIGFYKTYKSTVFNSENAFDYFLASGHFGIDITKHISLSFGHGQQFIGQGIRSLLLSDFSTHRLFLKLDTRVWKFHYQNIFAQLQLRGAKDDIGDQLIPTKYMAAHYLTFQLGKQINLGVFESVVFSRNNHFELQYLNPLIFYRTVEGAIGSPDNVIIGLQGDWSFAKRWQLYAQLVIDEFKLDELIQKRRGWWANKIGWQMGLKYIDVAGIDHLDLQVEYNSVRPYTYSHRDSSASSSHYNQALAHPLGANFNERLVKIRYAPFKKWLVNLMFLQADVADDINGQNFGNNILASSSGIANTRPFGNFIGQGIGADLNVMRIDVSYSFYHNMYIDFSYFYRNKNSSADHFDKKENYLGAGVRINFDLNKQFF